MKQGPHAVPVGVMKSLRQVVTGVVLATKSSMMKLAYSNSLGNKKTWNIIVMCASKI